MVIIYISNFLNNHVKAVSDNLFKEFGNDFIFIETKKIENHEQLKGASPLEFKNVPYLISAYDPLVKQSYLLDLCAEADVVIQGQASDKYVYKRVLAGKLTFRISEHIFKGGWKNPIRWIKYSLRNLILRNKNFFYLSASAYGSYDMKKTLGFRNRCFRWGYFPKLENSNFLIKENNNGKHLNILWVGRFLDWKHPEYAIEVAKYLRDKNISFQMTLIGEGPIKETIVESAKRESLEKKVKFMNNLSNKEIQTKMKDSDLFLFTSDHSEGWGVVLTEAMINGCFVIASDGTGATPYLVKDSENGLSFKNENLKDLLLKVDCFLSMDRERIIKIRNSAIQTIENKWSASVASRRLIRFIKDFEERKIYEAPKDGPMSKIYDK